ncbi:MAG: hypothetical protein KIIPBIDF_01564 [Candidatus Methanoperedenaceae archaeon GB50]|nr:MAG: hypothetical protein KIIPBIDF_01564 [Candidatus Methanoperedenaceae archaeon GB50]
MQLEKTIEIDGKKLQLKNCERRTYIKPNSGLKKLKF